MKAIDESSIKDQKQNIFDVSINTSNKKPSEFLIPNSFQSEQKQDNFLNFPMRSALENSKNNPQSFPSKRTYKDIFMNTNKNIFTSNNFQSKFNNNNLIFNKEPGLLNKITNNEKKNEENINKKSNDIINLTISKTDKKSKEKAPQEKFIEDQKKRKNDFDFLEKLLKEEQYIFLNDDYHITKSNQLNKIPENLPNYLIYKRAPLPDQILKNEFENSDYIIFPPLSCIISIHENILYFFNYINEQILTYSNFSKNIKKVHIATPKNGIFVNNIKFILIAILENEIHLLTLTLDDNDINSNGLPNIKETDFIINFNEIVTDIISSSNHRIFISTISNKIFELEYMFKDNNYFNFLSNKNFMKTVTKYSSGFFGIIKNMNPLNIFTEKTYDVIYKMEIDDTRNILYALKYTVTNLENIIFDNIIESTIIIFDLGIDGKSFNEIIKISNEDVYYDTNYYYNSYIDLNDNQNILNKGNIIINIIPLTRDKYKDNHLLAIKRNGQKIFFKFNTIFDDTYIPKQEEILQFNKSAFCRERITDSFQYTMKQSHIPSIISFYNNILNNNANNININNNIINSNNILYDYITYFPYETFSIFYYNNETILNVMEEDLSIVGKNQYKKNIIGNNYTEGDFNEMEEIIFKSTTQNKIFSKIIRISDFYIENNCFGHLLKFTANGFFINPNSTYIDDGFRNFTNIIEYNSMHDFAKQLFYPPEEIGILFNDEFIIYKKLRPIDYLVELLLNKNTFSIDDNINNILNASSDNISNRNNIDSNLSIRNVMTNPLNTNKEYLIMTKFNNFLNKYGYLETVTMLLNIITNSNFNYCLKNEQVSNKFSNNNINENDFKNNFVTQFYAIMKQNDNYLMNLGQDAISKLFVCSNNEIDNYIKDYKNLIQAIENVISNGNLNNNNNNNFFINNNSNNYYLKFDNNQYNEFTKNFINNNFIERNNFLISGYLLFISRVIRLFWEENIFAKSKLYFNEENNEYIIINNLNSNQIMPIKNILIKLFNVFNILKMDLLQKASDLNSKCNQLKQSLEKIDGFISNNSTFLINEIKNKLNDNFQWMIKEHKQFEIYFMNLFNFEKLSENLELCKLLTQKIIEILSFVEKIYELDITKELSKRKNDCNKILKIKIKDLLYSKSNSFIVKDLLQIIYEIYLSNKNPETASVQLQKIIESFPNLVEKSEIDAIEGTFILKYCRYNKNLNNFDRHRFLKDAVEKINNNLYCIKIEDVVNDLSIFNLIEDITLLCLRKGKILEKQANLNINKKNNLINIYNNEKNTLFDNNNKNDNNNNNDPLTNEFYKCISIIINLLDNINNSRVCGNFERYQHIKSTNGNIFSYPEYIIILLSNRSQNDFDLMEKLILNLSFKDDYEYIHKIILEYLKENNLLDKIKQVNTKSIEKYLNNQINIEQNSPSSLYSLYDFYFKNKNFACASNALLALINYKNPLNADNNSNYISLENRITYVNNILNVLELRIANAEYINDFDKRSDEIQESKKLKDKMLNTLNILNIQYGIKNFLQSYIDNYRNKNPEEINTNLDSYIQALIMLDRKAIDINELYHNYAKKFIIFDSCMSLLFQNKFGSNKYNNNPINEKEVKFIFFKFIYKFGRVEEWPYMNFDRFNYVFNLLIKEKTNYQNFYDMLKNNNMKNKYKDLLPIHFITSLIENKNKNLIYDNNDFIKGDNYLMRLKQDYKQKNNPFWFIIYLRQQLNLPLSYIFDIYFDIYLSLLKYNSNNNLFKQININTNNTISNQSENNEQSVEDGEHNIIVNDNESKSNNTINDKISYKTNNTNDEFNYNNYGKIFDGNLNERSNKPKSQDADFYCLFLLNAILEMWCNKYMYFINSNEFKTNNYNNSQDEYDMKMFKIEMKKAGNKFRKIIVEYENELKKLNLSLAEEKYEQLKIYGENIKNEFNLTENKFNEIEGNNERINEERSERNDNHNFGMSNSIMNNPFLSRSELINQNNNGVNFKNLMRQK